MVSKRAVVLLSGGLDSTTTLAIALSQGFECFALTFAYGQRHQREVVAAQRIVAYFKVKHHRIIYIDLSVFGGSALTDPAIDVPLNNPHLGVDIPITYVPARNTIFLSYALAQAEVLDCWDIFIGVNAVDYSGYPDCRPEYIAAFEQMANLATAKAVQGKGRYRIHTPIIGMTKAQIIQAGLQLGVDYSFTHSCYNPTPEGLACGQCDSCRLRLAAFRQIGMQDPIRYVNQS